MYRMCLRLDTVNMHECMLTIIISRFVDFKRIIFGLCSVVGENICTGFVFEFKVNSDKELNLMHLTW